MLLWHWSRKRLSCQTLRWLQCRAARRIPYSWQFYRGCGCKTSSMMLQRMCQRQHVGHGQTGEHPKHKESLRDYMSQLTWSLNLTEFGVEKFAWAALSIWTRPTPETWLQITMDLSYSGKDSTGSKCFARNARPENPQHTAGPVWKGAAKLSEDQSGLGLQPHVCLILVHSINKLTKRPRSSRSCEVWSPLVPLWRWSGTPAWTSCGPPSRADLRRQMKPTYQTGRAIYREDESCRSLIQTSTSQDCEDGSKRVEQLSPALRGGTTGPDAQLHRQQRAADQQQPDVHKLQCKWQPHHRCGQDRQDRRWFGFRRNQPTKSKMPKMQEKSDESIYLFQNLESKCKTLGTSPLQIKRQT